VNGLSFEKELQETFLTEASEMLEETEAAFVALESSPEDPAKIDKIFRFVHTIKGSAHVAGFSDLGQFAHIFETLLGILRDKKLSLSPDIVDVLLDGNDCLNEFVKALRSDRSAKINTSISEDRIREILRNARMGSEGFVQELSHPSSTQSKDADKTPPERAATGSAPRLPVPIFLVVDDEPQILQILERCLKDIGFHAITSKSVVSALSVFKAQPVDVIFTDLKMPDMDGIEFVKAVRKVNAFIPIAFISGHSTREHFKDYIKIGVDSFIGKPFHAEEVHAVAKRLVRESRMRHSMLTLSKLSFQTYVTVEKILSTLPLDQTHEADKLVLDRSMSQMRQATTDLLASERQLQELRCES